MGDSRSVRAIASRRRLVSLRLGASELAADPELASRVGGLLELLEQRAEGHAARAGIAPAALPAAESERQDRAPGAGEAPEGVAQGRTLELWLVELSPGPVAAEPTSLPRPGSARSTSSVPGAKSGQHSNDGAPHDTAIQRALELLESDVKKRWTVAVLAKAVGLSRAAFARRFAAALGASPIAHLTGLRLSRAARGLSAGDVGLAELAAEVGYDSEFAFSRAFKRRYGVPPATFRRLQRSLAAPGSSVVSALPGVARPGITAVLSDTPAKITRLCVPRLAATPIPVVLPPRCFALAA
jgi:AraC-like DNA-binding protein